MKVPAGIGAAILAIIAVIVIAVGAWQLNWFVKEKNTERQVQIDNRQLGTQTAWRDEALDSVGEYYSTDPANSAARGVLRSQACDLISRLDGPYRTDQLIAFYQEQCA